MLEGKRAALFDLDGTLIDSMQIWDDVDRELIEARGKEFPKDFIKEIAGMSFYQSTAYIAEKYGRPGETGEDVRKEFKKIVEHKILNEVDDKPRSWEFVKYCHDKGLKIGLATGSEKSIVVKLLEKKGMNEVFESVRVTSECQHSKPAPDVYLLVASDLGVDPKDCIVFEDLPAGIQAACNAGMEVCAVKDGFSEKWIKEKRELANYYSESYDDLLNGKYENLK